MNTLFTPKENPNTQYNYLWYALRVLVLPALLFWPFYVGASLLIGFSVPDIDCRGQFLCSTEFSSSGWQLGFIIHSLYSICVTFVIAPSRKSLLIAFSLALGIGLIDYMIANKITEATAQSMTERRFTFLPVELTLFAMFSLAFGMKTEPQKQLIKVSIGLLMGAFIFALGYEMSNAQQRPMLDLMLICFAQFCWPGFSAFREWLEGRWLYTPSVR